MKTYEVVVYDELCAQGIHMLTVRAKTRDQVIHIVESIADHEYEIIEIEELVS